jgi:hypothetical protein
MDRIDGDIAERQVGVGVAIGDLVAASELEASLELQIAFLRQRRDVRGRVEDFDVRVILEVGGRHDTRALLFEVERFRTFTVKLEGYLLEVENDVRHVLDDAGERRELVKNAFHANRRDSRPLDRGKQHAPERVTDGGTKTTLERLRNEATVVRREGLRIVVQLLRFLKI